MSLTKEDLPKGRNTELYRDFCTFILYTCPSNSTEVFQDSVEWMNSQIATWEDHLKTNEKHKVEAHNKRSNLESKKKAHNYSFDSGTSMSYTSQTTDNEGYVHDNKFTCVSVVSNKIGFTVNRMGYTLQIENELGGGTHWVDGWEEQESETFEYTLREDANTESLEDYNDAISVDVYEYGKYGPIFRTIGGQTSKPYEGQVVTKYYPNFDALNFFEKSSKRQSWVNK